MKANTHKQTEGRLEAITVVTFFIIFFILTILAGQVSAQVVNGNSGHCEEFNGNSSRVTFTNNDMGLGTGNTMSVTAWVKCISTSNEGSWASIVALNNSNNSASGDDGQFWLQHSMDNSVFEFAVENNSSNRVYVQSVTAPVTGQWYHIAGVYDGSYIKLYVNGVLEAQTAQTGRINAYISDYNLVFGEWANQANSNRRFNGDIDEVTIWNTALTQTQIRTNMCKKLQGTEAGLIGYWTMNEASGNKINDMTSNARTGKSLAATSVWSGAPIGDASTYTYGGTDISLNNPTYGDSLAVSNFSSAPIGIQIYRIDTMPNYTTAPLGFSVLATKYYYGVFIIGSTSPTYKMSYYYKGNPQVGVVSLFDMASRTDNSTTTWTAVTTILNTGIKALQKSSQSGRNEYIPTLKTGGLPIKLRSFTAIADGNQVDLNWATETEVNNNYFTIERTTDGVNYEAIATVKGAGNSDAELNYKATDESPVQGTSYYRLRQTDFDGNSQEFAPIAVNFSSNLSNPGFTLNNTYPNPFSNSFTMTFNSDKVQQLSIVIMSSNGTVIDNDAINCTEGNNTYNYNKGAMLSTGIYFVCVTDHSNGQKTVQKIVKL